MQKPTEPRVPISGVVLIDGQPLDQGSIKFVPTSGRPVSSPIQRDGSFELHEHSVSHPTSGLDVIPGRYRVAVSAAELINASTEEVRWLAPSRYADFRSSGIEVEVEGAQDDLLVELTWSVDNAADDVEKPVEKLATSLESADKTVGKD